MVKKQSINNNFKFSANLKILFAIAKESQIKSKELFESHRKPIPNTKDRFVITGDPSRGSFKNALTAIAFAGIYLEEFLYIQGLGRINWSTAPKNYLKKFEKMTYEKKLKALGIDDKNILEDCKKFRESRNDLIHEKPIIWESDNDEIKAGMKPINGPIKTAQENAEDAISFIDRIHKSFSNL